MNEVTNIEVYEWRVGEPRRLRSSHLVAHLGIPTNGQVPQRGDKLSIPVPESDGSWRTRVYVVLERELLWVRPSAGDHEAIWAKMWLFVREPDDQQSIGAFIPGDDA